MKFELKNVSHSESLSEETNAFTASLYIDGVKFCTVSNHGTGGPDDYSGVTRSEIERVNAWLKANTPKIESHGVTLDNDLELVVGDLLEDWLTRRDLKAAMRKDVLWRDSDGKLYAVKIKGRPVGTLIAAIATRHPGAPILNAMPEAEALAIWRQMGA